MEEEQKMALFCFSFLTSRGDGGEGGGDMKRKVPRQNLRRST
jgi:hypothetical protein